jgi:rhomboid family GlyGly-CTERM serine protease
MRAPGAAWAALAALLAGGAVAAWFLPADRIDWQPALAWREPWRAWTAAFVHWSPLHLGANLLGAVVVAALGLAARTPARLVLAWFAAWPLCQWGLLAWPELTRFGGLSGVLHGGVAAAAMGLLVQERGATRVIGGVIGAGLALKVLLERPWGPVLRHDGGWDIATAPLAHFTGTAAGALCAALVLATQLTAVAREP